MAHFGSEALAFLRGLARHNAKPWFEAHRAEYERNVRQPMADLVEEMDLRFARFAPACALLLHEFFEARLIDNYVLAAKNVLGKIQWKTVGVVEAKGDFAGEDFLLFGLEPCRGRPRHAACRKLLSPARHPHRKPQAEDQHLFRHRLSRLRRAAGDHRDREGDGPHRP